MDLLTLQKSVIIIDVHSFISLQLIDPNLMSIFKISCLFIETPAGVTLNCEDIIIGDPTITEQSVLVPYDAGLRENSAIFRLAYSYFLCSDSEVVNVSGMNNNSFILM